MSLRVLYFLTIFIVFSLSVFAQISPGDQNLTKGKQLAFEKKYEDAVVMFRRAIRYFECGRNSLKCGKCYYRIGQCELALGKNQSAAMSFQLASAYGYKAQSEVIEASAKTAAQQMQAKGQKKTAEALQADLDAVVAERHRNERRWHATVEGGKQDVIKVVENYQRHDSGLFSWLALVLKALPAIIVWGLLFASGIAVGVYTRWALWGGIFVVTMGLAYFFPWWWKILPVFGAYGFFRLEMLDIKAGHKEFVATGTDSTSVKALWTKRIPGLVCLVWFVGVNLTPHLLVFSLVGCIYLSRRWSWSKAAVKDRMAKLEEDAVKVKSNQPAPPAPTTT